MTEKYNRTDASNEFHMVDEIVMRHAFDIQNEFGRFCSEKIYQNELAYRCESDNRISSVATEFPINISHDSFQKLYKADLIINNSIIYELKTVVAFTPNHESQLLNYLLLTNNIFGKLINFKAASVEYRFVTTTLDNQSQHEYTIDDCIHGSSNNTVVRFKERIIQLIDDWGVFLYVELYTEAITQLLGGEPQIIKPISFYSSDRLVGKQKIHMLDEVTAFKLSASSKSLKAYENNIIKILQHTDLEQVVWVNLNHHFVTIKMVSLN